MHRSHPQAPAGQTRAMLNAAVGAALATLALVSTAAPASSAAERMELRFVQPEQFADIGLGSFDREQNLHTLREHFVRLADALPEGQRLQVEVLDVDLAGRIEPHRPQQLRVLRGNTDWPQITLRYTLTAGTTTLAQGEERLSDPNYLFPRRRALEHRPLPYERRMLDAWFKERFGALATAAPH